MHLFPWYILESLCILPRLSTHLAYSSLLIVYIASTPKLPDNNCCMFCLTALVTLDATKQMGQGKEDRGITSASSCFLSVRTSDWSRMIVRARVYPTHHHAPARLLVLAPSFLDVDQSGLPRALRRCVLVFLLPQFSVPFVLSHPGLQAPLGDSYFVIFHFNYNDIL